MTTKLGIVGIGKWAQTYFNTVADLDDIEIIGWYTPNGEDSLWSGRVPDGCPRFSTYERLLAAVDGVILAGPPCSVKGSWLYEARLNYMCSARDAGKPMVVEKPITIETIASYNWDHSPPILVNHTHMWSDHFLNFRNNFKEILGGDYRNIAIETRSWGPFRQYSPLLDWGPHAFAFYLALCEEHQNDPVIVVQRKDCVLANAPKGLCAGGYKITLCEQGSMSRIATIDISNVSNRKTVEARVSAGGYRDVYRPGPDPSPMRKMLTHFAELIKDPTKRDWREGLKPDSFNSRVHEMTIKAYQAVSSI